MDNSATFQHDGGADSSRAPPTPRSPPDYDPKSDSKDAAPQSAAPVANSTAKMDEVCQLPASVPVEALTPHLAAMYHILGIETVRVASEARAPAYAFPAGIASFLNWLAPGDASGTVVAVWDAERDGSWLRPAGAGDQCVRVPFAGGVRAVAVPVAQPRLPDAEAELLALLGVPTRAVSHRGADLSVIDAASGADVAAGLRAARPRGGQLPGAPTVQARLTVPTFPATYNRPPTTGEAFLARAFGRGIFRVGTRTGDVWVVHTPERVDRTLESIGAYL